jgi:hypothetical protein
MKIFLRQISAKATNADLRAVVERTIAPRWYLPRRRTGVIQSCNVLKIEDPGLKTVEFHGIVDVRPENAALSAVLKLNGRRLLGTLVEAREWHERSVERDRRKHESAQPHPIFQERRHRERRRSDLSIQIL